MNRKTILWIVVGILILGLILLIFLPRVIDVSRDSGMSGDDLCKPTAGYTEDSWREHMSHHPDIYKSCLT